MRVAGELPRPQHAALRKLLRKPLLAVLRAPTSKPQGVFARARRVIAAEAAWNARELRHAWTTLKRGDVFCGRRDDADVGKVFRCHASTLAAPGAAEEAGAGEAWLITEVQLSFGLFHATRRAAAWRSALRSEKRASALEAALCDALVDGGKGLEIEGACSETVIFLMDDAPHSRLGGKTEKVAGGGKSGLDFSVARRGEVMLRLCAKDHDDKEHEHEHEHAHAHDEPEHEPEHDKEAEHQAGGDAGAKEKEEDTWRMPPAPGAEASL